MSSRLPLILLIVITSCSFPVPQKFVQQFECYSGKYTGLDTLISTHGFYTSMVVSDNRGFSTWGADRKLKPMGIDTSFYSFLFFADGIFIGDVGTRGMSVSDYINHSGLKKEAVWGSVQGIYSISGDTIKVKFMGNGHSNNQWFGREIWYKVIDKNTIIDFYSKPLVVLREDRKKEEYQPRTYLDAEPSKFVFVPNMPESSSWLKKEKWFNCN